MLSNSSHLKFCICLILVTAGSSFRIISMGPMLCEAWIQNQNKVKITITDPTYFFVLTNINLLTISGVIYLFNSPVSALSNLWTVATVCSANRGRTPKIWRITWTGERTWFPPFFRVSCPPSSCRTTGASSRRRRRCSSGRRTLKRSRDWERSSWRPSPAAWICEAFKEDVQKDTWRDLAVLFWLGLPLRHKRSGL